MKIKIVPADEYKVLVAKQSPAQYVDIMVEDNWLWECLEDPANGQIYVLQNIVENYLNRVFLVCHDESN